MTTKEELQRVAEQARNMPLEEIERKRVLYAVMYPMEFARPIVDFRGGYPHLTGEDW